MALHRTGCMVLPGRTASHTALAHRRGIHSIGYGQAPGLSLGVPGKRPIPQNRRKPEPPWLPPVQDCFHNVRRDAGQRKEANEGDRHR